MQAQRHADPLLLLVLVALFSTPVVLSQGVDAEKESPASSAEQPEKKTDGEDNSAPLESGLREEVRVDVVQVNFLALDRKGKPVTDLQPEELEVEVNRKKVRVAFLERNAIEGKKIKEIKKTPALSGTRVEQEEIERRDQQERWIVLFFDSYTAGPRTRLKSVDAAATWILKEMRPSDHVAVIDFHGKLKVLQAFTQDEFALQRALQQISDSTPFAFSDRHDTLQTLRTEFEECLRKGTGSYALACIHPYVLAYEADRLREQRDFISALLILMRAISPIPHIKSIIMFSDGFARVPGQDAIDVASTVVGFREAMTLNLNHRADNDYEFREITEAASKARVSIHAIMPGGGKSFGFVSAAERKPINETAGSRIDYYARSAKNYQQGFTELALRTGGAISLNADPSLALERVLDQSQGLYTIGVYTSGVQAYRDYEFEIESKRRGVRIRSWERMPRFRIPARLEGSIEATASECKPGNRRALDLEVSIPRQELAFKPVKGGRSANFSVFVTMVDQDSGETLFEEFRFFNIQTASADLAKDAVADPRMTERFLAPCRPLLITASITDAEAGAVGKLVTSVE